MRVAAVVLTALLAVASGCLEDGNAEPVAEETAPGPVANVTAPAPMHWEGGFTVGADPTNIVTNTPCAGVANACDFRDFTINGTFDVEATLTWNLEANDLDLYLYQGETQVSQDGINLVGDVPTNSQVLVHADLPPGDYTFWVVAWNAVEETYLLDATFS